MSSPKPETIAIEVLEAKLAVLVGKRVDMYLREEALRTAIKILKEDPKP